MNDEVARALAPQPGGAKPSTTDVLRAIQSAARDSAPSKFLKKMSQPLLEVMDSLLESRRYRELTNVLRFLAHAAQSTPRRFGVAALAPPLLESGTLARILEQAYASEPVLQQVAIALVGALAGHHPSLVIPSSAALGPFLCMAIDFGVPKDVAPVMAYATVLKAMVCANDIVESMSDTQRLAYLNQRRRANNEALAALLRALPWLGDYELQMETIQLLLAIMPMEDRRIFTDLATATTMASSTSYPPLTADDGDAFVAIESEQDATELLHRLNARAKTVITKELASIVVKGQTLPPAFVAAAPLVHFNRGSATLSIPGQADDMAPYEALLGPPPIVIHRQQVSEYDIQGARLRLALDADAASAVGGNAALFNDGIPGSTRSVELSFDNGLFLAVSAGEVFGTQKKTGQPQPRASVTAALVVSRTGRKVSPVQPLTDSFQRSPASSPASARGSVHDVQASPSPSPSPVIARSGVSRLSRQPPKEAIATSEAAVSKAAKAAAAAAAAEASKAAQAAKARQDAKAAEAAKVATAAKVAEATKVAKAAKAAKAAKLAKAVRVAAAHEKANKAAAAAKSGSKPAAGGTPSSDTDFVTPKAKAKAKRAAQRQAIEEEEADAHSSSDDESQTHSGMGDKEQGTTDAALDAEIQALVNKLRGRQQTKPGLTDHFKAAPLRADAATRAPKTPGSAARPVAPRYTPLVMQNSAKSPTGVSGKARGTTSARKVSQGRAEASLATRAFLAALAAEGEDVDSSDEGSSGSVEPLRERRRAKRAAPAVPCTAPKDAEETPLGPQVRQGQPPAKTSKLATKATVDTAGVQRNIDFNVDVDAGLLGSAIAAASQQALSKAKEAETTARARLEGCLNALENDVESSTGQEGRIATLINVQRQQASKREAAARRTRRRLAAAAQAPLEALSSVAARRQADAMAQAEAGRALARDALRRVEAAATAGTTLRQAAENATAKLQAAQRLGRTAMAEELESQARGQAKKQQQLMQLLAVVSSDM